MFEPKSKLTINSLLAWMDGGTITLLATDDYSNEFKIEFTQTMFLEKRKREFYPGSLIINEKIVAVRSDLEARIILAIRNAAFSPKIDDLDKSLITECLEFVLSDNYVTITKKFNRI